MAVYGNLIETNINLESILLEIDDNFIITEMRIKSSAIIKDKIMTIINKFIVYIEQIIMKIKNINIVNLYKYKLNDIDDNIFIKLQNELDIKMGNEALFNITRNNTYKYKKIPTSNISSYIEKITETELRSGNFINYKDSYGGYEDEYDFYNAEIGRKVDSINIDDNLKKEIENNKTDIINILQGKYLLESKKWLIKLRSNIGSNNIEKYIKNNTGIDSNDENYTRLLFFLLNLLRTCFKDTVAQYDLILFMSNFLMSSIKENKNN